MDKSEKIYIETLEKKCNLLLQALLIGGKYAREWLPAQFPDDPEYFNIICGGGVRDPEGKDFVNYWLYQAQQKEKN